MDAQQDRSLWRLLVAALDEVDYGMLLLADGDTVCHANRAAGRELDGGHPLQLLGDQLRARHGRDVAPLRAALEGASVRGLRRLLQVGEGERATMVAVVPLTSVVDGTRLPTLLTFGKRHVCEQLSVQAFACAHGLTPAEAAVLQRLCSGERAHEIADHQGVAISTVRTQIGSIRNKTAAPSVRELLAQVARLPPLVNLVPA